MKKFIAEYLNIISYTTIGLVLMVASFYLFMNYYHSQELKKTIYVQNTSIEYITYQDKLNQISNNLNKFTSKKSTNESYQKLYNKLFACNKILRSEGTLFTFVNNTNRNNYDVYLLGSKFQSDVLNVCYAMHLSYLNDENIDEELKQIAPFVTNNITILTNQVNFALKEIQNNSSYYYSTNITSSTIRNDLLADYDIIANAYISFANIILNLSEFINEEGDNENA